MRRRPQSKCDSLGVKSLTTSSSPAVVGGGAAHAAGYYWIVGTANEVGIKVPSAEVQNGPLFNAWQATMGYVGIVGPGSCPSSSGALVSNLSTCNGGGPAIINATGTWPIMLMLGY
jgi:hypothetical protein